MTQKTPTKQAPKKKEEPKQPATQAESLAVQETKPEDKVAPKQEEEKAEPAKAMSLANMQEIVESLAKTVAEHSQRIAELQEMLARKRKPVASNGKIQIKDLKTGTVYPSKNNCYQSLLKAGELKDLVDKGVFGDNPEKNTFGWYALVREQPNRFEEVKPDQAQEKK